MEVVDVLGDDAIEPAETPQSDEGVVTGIGFGATDHRIDGAAELPVAPAPGLGTDEVLESELARKVNSLGSKRSQTPPGLRKSGIPDSVLMPAPVKTTVRCEASTQSAIRSKRPVTSGVWPSSSIASYLLPLASV